MKESKDATTKKTVRRETLCGRLDRTINYARAIKYHIQYPDMLNGKGRRHGHHNTGLDTKTKRNKACYQ